MWIGSMAQMRAAKIHKKFFVGKMSLKKTTCKTEKRMEAGCSTTITVRTTVFYIFVCFV
jgi:hypothetical protein